MTKYEETLLREAIKKMFLMEKAHTQEVWTDNLLEYLTGAIREFYKARLARKNSLCVQQDYDHWLFNEVSRLLDSFARAYFHEVKGSFNKEKAFKKVQVKMSKIDDGRRRNATTRIINYYSKRIGNKRLIPLDDDDTLEFWKLVQETIDNYEEE